MLRWTGKALVLGISIIALLAGPASASHVQCGAVIKASTTLDSDLVDCPGTAIRIQGSGITLDLGGHTVDGTGSGLAGVVTIGPDRSNDITVRNGTVRQFRAGVVLNFGTSQLLEDVVVTENETGAALAGANVAPTVRNVLAFGNVTGINVSAVEGATVVDNEMHSNSAGMGGGTIERSLIARNSVHDNEFTAMGFRAMLDSRISDNRVRDNGLVGILLTDSSRRNLLLDNRVVGSGADGIAIDAEAAGDNVVNRNRTDRNADDGIDVDYAGATLTGNTANNNGDLGIEAVAGTIDGGNNKASANGNPAQCAGVSCK